MRPPSAGLHQPILSQTTPIGIDRALQRDAARLRPPETAARYQESCHRRATDVTLLPSGKDPDARAFTARTIWRFRPRRTLLASIIPRATGAAPDRHALFPHGCEVVTKRPERSLDSSIYGRAVVATSAWYAHFRSLSRHLVLTAIRRGEPTGTSSPVEDSHRHLTRFPPRSRRSPAPHRSTPRHRLGIDVALAIPTPSTAPIARRSWCR